MEKQINPIVATVFMAHEVGAIAVATNSMPCSLCVEVIKKHPDAELVYDDHFHGSNFSWCKRKLYLTMINGRQTGLNRASFLTMGHYFEREMLANIKAGLSPNYELKILENRSEVITEILGFKLVTHCDAYLIDKVNSKVYIVECKAIKNKYFAEIKKSKQLREEWVGQGQSYLFSHQDTDGLIFLVKNRDTSELLFPFFIERDNNLTSKRLMALSEVHQRIQTQGGMRSSFDSKGLASNMPNREHIDKKDFECTFCPFKIECWQN